MSANISRSTATQNRFQKKKDTAHLSIFASVRLVSFVADNKEIVSRVASMACRMSILRLRRAAVSNLRTACVAVLNLGIWGPIIRQHTCYLQSPNSEAAIILCFALFLQSCTVGRLCPHRFHEHPRLGLAVQWGHWTITAASTTGQGHCNVSGSLVTGRILIWFIDHLNQDWVSQNYFRLDSDLSQILSQ